MILTNGEKIKEVIDLKNETVSAGLQRLLAKYDVQDVNVFDVDLETVIREMYAENK